jgi:NADPH:quinone reductase-like Zn-dependent oxidoreductase
MGKIALIDNPKSLDFSKLKHKSLSPHWEFMFIHSMFKTTDIDEQHRIFTQIADLINRGYIQTTLSKNEATINTKNLRVARKILGSGKSIGKIVLEGF